MPDPLRKVLDALVGSLPADCHESALLADVLWLAASCADLPQEEGTPLPQAAEAEVGAAGAADGSEPVPVEQPADRHSRPDGPDGRREVVHHGPYGLYENLPGEFEDAHDAPVVVAAGRALPQAVELGRALRPFMRRFPHGRRTGLDLAATIDSYTRDGELLPVVAPLPEPWFDVLLVIDTHLSMEVWQDAVQEFAQLLENCGAFRRVQRWHLSTEPHPDVTDARGRVVNSRSVTAPDERRLVLVVSDCAAPAWYGKEVWQLLRGWAGQCSVSIASPLPSRLWHRTGLDLPAVRVRSRLPGARNTALAVTVPPHLRSVLKEGTTYVPVPTFTLTAHSLDRWAQGLFRGSPEGYEAVLVTPFGAPDDPFAAGPDEETGSPVPWHQGVNPAEAFIRTGSYPAVRLGGLCSAFRRLSLPLIQLIRQEVVPEATNSDLAELLMSEVLDISASREDPRTITFRETARAPLARTAGRHDAWRVLDALSHHIAERVRLPGQGLNAIAALDTAELPNELRPFAYASAELVTALRAGAPPGPTAGPDVGGSEGVQGRASGEGVRLFLPDPLRSAAVLIGGGAADGAGEDAHAFGTALAELSSLLTSPEGWDLPDERCVRLAGAGAQRVRQALHAAAAMADDALLVWYVGHRPPRGGAADAWVLGETGETLLPDAVLAELDVAHLVVMEEGCSAKQSVRLAQTRRPRTGVTWLTYEPAAEEGPPGLTTQVLRVIAEGVPGAPPLLTVEQLVQAAARSAPAGWSLRSTLLEHPDGAVPAFARNRAAAPLPARSPSGATAAPPGGGASDASVTRLLAQVRADLRLEEAGAESAAAAEQVLEALLSCLSARIRNPRPDRTLLGSGGGGSFRAELVDFLAPYGVTVSDGPGFSILLHAQEIHDATAIPTEVLNLSDRSRWIRPHYAPDPSRSFLITPFALLLVLDGAAVPDGRTFAERVGVHRDADSCVVTLRFPGTPSAPFEPTSTPLEAPVGMAAAVAGFCAAQTAPGPRRWSPARYGFEQALSPIAPKPLSDHHIVAVRPDLTALQHPPPDGRDDEVSVPATVELAGLWPTERLTAARGVAVLSTSESHAYSFVAVELAVVLVLALAPSDSLGLVLRRIEGATH
ncbi:SAV_2336 N-terminal domain-related protein [Streptomyces xanthophaeus]